MPPNKGFSWGERGLYYARQFCYPRLVGTPGEKKAASAIKENLAGLGYHVLCESFSIYKTPWGYTRILMGASLLLLGFSRFLLSYLPLLGCFIILLLIVLEIGGGRGWLWFVRQKDGREIATSENIWADLHPSDNASRLIISAHYDSKSQSLKLKSRIYWLGAGMVSLVLLSVVYLKHSYYPSAWHLPAANILGMTAAISALRLMVVGTGNESPGALDNASGVGAVLACAEYFAQNPPAGISIRYLFFGAEEYGLQGSVHHVEAHLKEWQSFDRVVNFDGVGISGALRWATSLVPSKSDPLVKQVIGAAHQAGVSLKRIPLYPGLMMDHIPFQSISVPAVSLCCVAPASGLIHSSRDKETLLEQEGFTEIGAVITNLAKDIEKTFQVPN